MGLIRYNFGEDVRVQNVDSILTLNDDDMKGLMERAKKIGMKTKQEGKQKRQRSTTTPIKARSRKKRPVMSTPV